MSQFTTKKIRCLQAALYVSARVQALTALSGYLVRTVNGSSRVAQLTSHCSRTLYMVPAGTPRVFQDICVQVSDVTHHIMLLHQRLRPSDLYFGTPFTILNTSV